MRHSGLWTLLIVIATVGLTVGPALAAEDSVYDWWLSEFGTALVQYDLDTDSNSTTGGGGSGGYYGAGFDADGDDAADYWGVWHNGDAYSEIEIELSGWDNVTSFGWYGWDLSGSTYTAIDDTTRNNYTISPILHGTTSFGLYEIFSGSDAQNATWTSVTDSWFNDHTYDAPEMWGFYLKGNDGYWFSEWALNDRTGSYQNQRSLEVFDYPGHETTGTKWVLGWEVEERAGWDDDGWNYDGDIYNMNDHYAFEMWGAPVSPDGGLGNAKPYDNDNTTAEPDYQDMILSFERLEYTQHDWDNSPELGTWALLLCTGALGGWIRRRRTD